MRGRILKAVAGDYWVKVNDTQIVARPRGLFRYENQKPAVGDEVELEGETITNILPRKNLLRRPFVANIDAALLVFSVKDPTPDFLLLDKLIISVLAEGIEPHVVFSKTDLVEEDLPFELAEDYSFLPVYYISNMEKASLEKLIKELVPGTYVLAGPSGAGKSSMINQLAGRTEAPVGEISQRLRRGKHTTRHHELIDLGGDVYLADTPGFQNLEVKTMEPIELQDYFPDFHELDPCQFDDCLHDQEPRCQVKEAVKEGILSQRRYDHYLRILRELIERKEKQW